MVRPVWSVIRTRWPSTTSVGTVASFQLSSRINVSRAMRVKEQLLECVKQHQLPLLPLRQQVSKL